MDLLIEDRLQQKDVYIENVEYFSYSIESIANDDTGNPLPCIYFLSRKNETVYTFRKAFNDLESAIKEYKRLRQAIMKEVYLLFIADCEFIYPYKQTSIGGFNMEGMTLEEYDLITK